MSASNGSEGDRAMRVSQDLGLGFFFGSRSSRSFFSRAAFGSLFRHCGRVFGGRIGRGFVGNGLGNRFSCLLYTSRCV